MFAQDESARSARHNIAIAVFGIMTSVGTSDGNDARFCEIKRRGCLG
ncbi:hypothetical protein AB395_00001902 [Sinorhizobium fredii CCBAU 45436]|nr:hypothetical protein AB395_00001902 [Sinorhizobium fredii CCBAU 45436]AWM25407.1 hypothetical protein AOX55_00002155 [Sinorhizobium fredii CCBAU 25509]